MSARFATHDRGVVSTFDIVGSYFVDSFFNHVYAGARAALAAGAGDSLTDEYVRRLQAYVLGVKSDERCYGDVVRGVHLYFTRTTRYTTLGFAEFVNRIVGACVPGDYFRQFTPQDKDELLSSVLCDLVSALAVCITTPEMLRLVIDNHDRTPDVTIRMLQDTAVSSLLEKRASLHNKFLQKVGQADPQDSSISVLKQALRRLVREKTEAVAAAAAAEAAAVAARGDLRSARSRAAKLTRLVELLRAERDQGQTAAAAAACLPSRDTLAEGSPGRDAFGSLACSGRGRRAAAVLPRGNGSDGDRGADSDNSDNSASSVAGDSSDAAGATSDAAGAYAPVEADTEVSSVPESLFDRLTKEFDG